MALFDILAQTIPGNGSEKSANTLQEITTYIIRETNYMYDP